MAHVWSVSRGDGGTLFHGKEGSVSIISEQPLIPGFQNEFLPVKQDHVAAHVLRRTKQHYSECCVSSSLIAVRLSHILPTYSLIAANESSMSRYREDA